MQEVSQGRGAYAGERRKEKNRGRGRTEIKWHKLFKNGVTTCRTRTKTSATLSLGVPSVPRGGRHSVPHQNPDYKNLPEYLFLLLFYPALHLHQIICRNHPFLLLFFSAVHQHRTTCRNYPFLLLFYSAGHHHRIICRNHPFLLLFYHAVHHHQNGHHNISRLHHQIVNTL